MLDLDLCLNEYRNRTDEELVAAAKTDKSAADAVALRYSKLILIKSGIYASVDADSDELRQEGLIALFDAIRAFNPSKGFKFSTFAETCIVNRMLTFLKRAKKVSEKCQSLDDGLAEILPQEETPESIYLNKEFFVELYEAIDSELSETEKQVISLFVGGTSYRDIALQLDMNEKAVDNAMQRARKKLRKCFGE